MKWQTAAMGKSFCMWRSAISTGRSGGLIGEQKPGRSIEAYVTGEELLASGKRFDIVFLDIHEDHGECRGCGGADEGVYQGKESERGAGA